MKSPKKDASSRSLPQIQPDEKGLIRIDKDFIAALPLMQYTGKIVQINDEKSARKAVKALLKEKVLGFDTETRPSFSRGLSYLTSLVQLCGKKCAYLFRLDYCGGVPVLFPIFENPDILKVGVAVKEDVLHLKRRAPFDDAGFVDASVYTRKVGIDNTGLRALCAYFLGGRISKAAQVSNWAAKTLTDQQVTYAATDAWISRELFLKIQSLGIAPNAIERKSICEETPTAKKAEPKDTKKSPKAAKKPQPRYTKQSPKAFDMAEVLGEPTPSKPRRRPRRKPKANPAE